MSVYSDNKVFLHTSIWHKVTKTLHRLVGISLCYDSNNVVKVHSLSFRQECIIGSAGNKHGSKTIATSLGPLSQLFNVAYKKVGKIAGREDLGTRLVKNKQIRSGFDIITVVI